MMRRAGTAATGALIGYRRTPAARSLLGLLLLLVAGLALACGGDGAGEADAVATPPESSSLAECIAEDGYPCNRSQVDPAVLDLESEYAGQALAMLDAGGSREDALAWLQAQDGVVETYLDETSLVFRVDGGMPVVFIDPLESDDTGEGSQGAAFDAGPAPISYVQPNAPASASPPPGGVVGEGTARDNPQNRKLALILTPFEWQNWSMFNVPAEAGPTELLRSIPDYNHHPLDVAHISNDMVTPYSFMGWESYDAIFLETHGSNWRDAGTWIGTGVKRVWPIDPPLSYKFVCDELWGPYKEIGGTTCGIVTRHSTNTRYMVVGLLPRFFRDNYGEEGGLDKAIVYFGGCKTMGTPDVAAILAGSSSAYLGWTGSVNISREKELALSLLFLLASEANGSNKTVGAAREALCRGGRCTGAGFPEGVTTDLVFYENGDEPKKLRLYDIPTLRDPRAPTSGGLGLEDGAQLEIIGTPGDGRNDKLELVVDLIGVIDPADTSVPEGNIVQTDSPATLYNLRVLLGEEGHEIGLDNLGRPQDPTAKVTPLGDTRYRYAFTAELPFDVDPDGTAARLEVVVDLPEGGISDYEVNVTLVGREFAMCDIVGPASERLADAFDAEVPLTEILGHTNSGYLRSECHFRFEGQAEHPEGFLAGIMPYLHFEQLAAIYTSVEFAVGGIEGSPQPVASLGDGAVVIGDPEGDDPSIDDPSVYFEHGGRVYHVQGYNGWGYIKPTPNEGVIAAAEVLLELLSATTAQGAS